VSTDIIMPEQEGCETILQIRREYPKIKIIAISGGLRQGDRDGLFTAMALEADEAIAKPLDPQDLLSRLAKLAL
jgi:CheY-like chemotaxis protein